MRAGAEPFLAPGSGTRQTASTAVLAVHGLTSSPQMIRPVAHDLAEQGYAVHAPLLPGHGTQPADLARTRYADWFGAVEGAAVDLFADRRVRVGLGISLGGALVTDLAIRRPDLVDALVLVNPALSSDDPRVRLLPLLRHVVRSVPGIGDDIRRAGPPRELCYDRVPTSALASFVARWPALITGLAQVRVPILLLRSAYDRVVPASSSDLVLRHAAGPVTEVVLTRSAHVATLDHDRETLVAATRDFIGDLAAGGRS